MAVVEALKNISFFNNFDDAVLEPISEACSTELYDRGANVFRRGDAGSKIFFVQSGRVDVVGDIPPDLQFVLSTIESGDFFGEMGILSDTRHSTTGVVQEDLISLVLHREDFNNLISVLPRTAMLLLKTLGCRLSRRYRQFNEQFLFTRSIAGTLDEPGSDRETIQGDHPDAILRHPLDGEIFKLLSSLGERLTLGKGEVIIPEGGKKRDFYVLVDGKAIVKKYLPGGSALVLSFLEPGCLLGEMSFLDHGFRSAQVESLTPVTLAAFWPKKLDILEKTDMPRLNTILLGILRYMLANINQTNEQYLEAKHKIHTQLHAD